MEPRRNSSAIWPRRHSAAADEAKPNNQPVRYSLPLQQPSSGRNSPAELNRTASLPGTIPEPTNSAEKLMDDLMNQGVWFIGEPRAAYVEAIEKFKAALPIAEQANDIIRMAKLYSNMGAAHRIVGNILVAKEYVERSWNLTMSYIRQESCRDSNSWLQLAIRATGLEGMEGAFMTHSEDHNINYPSVQSSGKQVSQGPPIVVWILELMNNMGNVCYSMGNFEAAVKCHSTCKKLVDSIFEDFPPPPEIMNCYLAASNVGSNSNPVTSSYKKFKLSYLHQSAIISLVQSLEHLGVSFGALGFSTTCLQYHTLALELLNNISELVPGFSDIYDIKSDVPNSIDIPTRRLRSGILLYLAGIKANLGHGWKMNGDFAKSIYWHRKSLEYYAKYSKYCQEYIDSNMTEPRIVGLHETRQIIQFGTCYLQLGVLLNAGVWIRSMEKSAAAIPNEDINAAKIFWRINPSDSNLANYSQFIGLEKTVDKALSIHLYHSKAQFQMGDWTGLYVSWMNIGINL